MNTIGAVLLATLAGSAPVSAPATDFYFEQTTVAYSGGRPSGPGVVSRIWYSGQRMRMEAGGVAPAPALILRLDQGKAYRVDPAERRVTVLDAERLRTRGQMDSAMAGELMGAENARVVTTPLPGERTVAGYRCRGFGIGVRCVDLWVTAAPHGIRPRRLHGRSRAADSLGPFLGEIRRLLGSPAVALPGYLMGETHGRCDGIRVKVATRGGVFDPPGLSDGEAE